MSDRTSTALAHSEGPPHTLSLVRPVGDPSAIIEAHKQVTGLVAAVLEQGTDYGTIPGTDRPTLYKAGAERLTFAIGARARFEIVEHEAAHETRVRWRKTRAVWEGPKGRRRKVRDEVSEGDAIGLYRYVVRCVLVRREDDHVLGEGIGSCSTLEGKYCERPRECENTVLKMARKRAQVDAVLATLGLSDRFTEPDEVESDDDGAVEDPTDGLTLAEAMEYTVRGKKVGELKVRALVAIEEWCATQVEASPADARALRRHAAVTMVRKHKERQEAESASGAAQPGDAAENAESAPSLDSDSESE